MLGMCLDFGVGYPGGVHGYGHGYGFAYPGGVHDYGHGYGLAHGAHETLTARHHQVHQMGNTQHKAFAEVFTTLCARSLSLTNVYQFGKQQFDEHAEACKKRHEDNEAARKACLDVPEGTGYCFEASYRMGFSPDCAPVQHGWQGGYAGRFHGGANGCPVWADPAGKPHYGTGSAAQRIRGGGSGHHGWHQNMAYEALSRPSEAFDRPEEEATADE